MNFTLGQVFDMWQQPLTSGQVGPRQGAIYAYVDGQPFLATLGPSPSAATPWSSSTLARNAPPPAPYTFPQGL